MRIALPFSSRSNVNAPSKADVENATWIRRTGSFVVALLVIVIALSLSGCFSAKVPIDAENVAPLWNKVLERHDHYVIADTSLTEDERTSFLVSTELIREVLSTAMAKTKTETKAIPDPSGS